MPELNAESRRHFLSDLRDARAAAHANAEAFQQVLFAVERLGAFLLGRNEALGKYRERLRAQLIHAGEAEASLPHERRNVDRFDQLFGLINEGRNDAMHQGAAARHITRHCIELALLLEEALVALTDRVEDFMAAQPIAAKLFEPLGSIRRTMLMNAFSHLPVQTDEGWHLLSDVAVATNLRASPTSSERKRRLAAPLADALAGGALSLETQCQSTGPDENVAAVASRIDHRPALVFQDGDSRKSLVGLMTAFDLL